LETNPVRVQTGGDSRGRALGETIAPEIQLVDIAPALAIRNEQQCSSTCDPDRTRIERSGIRDRDGIASRRSNNPDDARRGIAVEMEGRVPRHKRNPHPVLRPYR